jgi:hypothetical protein
VRDRKKDDPLKPLLAGLKSNRAGERIRAIEQLKDLGEDARPAAKALCELIASDPRDDNVTAALAALEKVYRELYHPVQVLRKDEDPENHRRAAGELGRMGEQGRDALAVLLAHIRTVQSALASIGNAQTGKWHPITAMEVIKEDARALARIGPDDPAVQKLLLDLARLGPGANERWQRGTESVSSVAVQALGELAQQRPEQAQKIAPDLIAATQGMTDRQTLGDALKVLGSMAESNPDLRRRIADGLLALLRTGEVRAISQLPKCGSAAEVALPALREHKFNNPLELVRTAATKAVSQIEEALARKEPDATDAPTRRPGTLRQERPPPPPTPDERAEEPRLPARLRPVVDRLKSGTTEERLEAAADLAEMGEKAAPASRALCEMALNPTEKVSRAALQALKKVNPELHEAVFVLVVDGNAQNHQKALTTLAALADQGKPATPVVLREIHKGREQLTTPGELPTTPGARWHPHIVVPVIAQSMKTLAKIAADDPQAVKTLIELTKFSPGGWFPSISRRGSFPSTTPFRHPGIEILGEVAEAQPDRRKQIIPPLVAALKEAAQQTSSNEEHVILAAIAEVELAGEALIKCGVDGKDAVVKEVLPRLKDLEFHKSDRVRKTAEELRRRVENSP